MISRGASRRESAPDLAVSFKNLQWLGFDAAVSGFRDGVDALGSRRFIADSFLNPIVGKEA